MTEPQLKELKVGDILRDNNQEIYIVIASPIKPFKVVAKVIDDYNYFKFEIYPTDKKSKTLKL